MTHPTTNRDIWVLPLEGERTPWAYIQTPFEEKSAMLSPDGRWLAYGSTESGQPEVYVQAFPEPGGRWQVSTDGGEEPLWSPNGHELFYRIRNKILAAAIATEPVFAVKGRKVLFEGGYVEDPFHTNYDIHPDGKRFVMIKTAAASTQLIIVLNWFEELKRIAR